MAEPIGIETRQVWVKKRTEALIKVISRYLEQGLDPYPEWYKELSDHLNIPNCGLILPKVSNPVTYKVYQKPFVNHKGEMLIHGESKTFPSSKDSMDDLGY